MCYPSKGEPFKMDEQNIATTEATEQIGFRDDIKPILKIINVESKLILISKNRSLSSLQRAIK